MHRIAGIAGAVDLDSPGRYLHWSILQVSEANLVLVLVMVLLFALALIVPFPGRHRRRRAVGAPVAGAEVTQGGDMNSPPDNVEPALDGETARHGRVMPAAADVDQETASMWTYRIRRRALSVLPPGKLLPDRQPAYVASWIYVFGVATMVALGMVILSGIVIAIGGVDWWHSNPVGHFFNSMHLWSVELFMAFMVIHLWGKFWMAAWRGKRRLTWITGVVAFVASVVEAFTGYLSQQNFDSQWISANGKDAINATGLGAFFDLMNFGQMLAWHIVIVPIILVSIVGAHVLLVRVRGVSHPLPRHRPPAFGRGRDARLALAKSEAAEWRGPTRRYDIVKEATVAGAVVLVLVLLLATILSSPDEPPVTVQSWAQVAPADFLATAASELAGTSETATYGPPYNHGSAFVQRIVVSPQTWVGVRQPIDAATSFVIDPLLVASADNRALGRAVSKFRRASLSTQRRWAQAYLGAVTKVTFGKDRAPSVPVAQYGPVATMLASELTLARSGAIDADLLSQHQFYGTNFTKPLLFLEDGQYFSSVATAQHLVGTQWGVMNETGSYPGQPWLWLYTLWYQVPGWRSSTNVDLIAIGMTGIATALLVAVPFIPGLRDIPRWIPLHRLVWKDWNDSVRDASDGGVAPPSSEGT